MDSRLRNASTRGDVEALKQLLEEDPLILHMVTFISSETPLHISSLLGHIEFTKEVINRNPQLASELNHYGFTPIHLASSKGHLGIVKELLKVDKKLSLVKDQYGRNPLHLAAIKGRIHVLKELLSCYHLISAKEVTPRGETILHLAVKNNQFEALKALVVILQELNLDKELVNAKDSNGDTILHLATARKQLQTIKFLMNETNVEVKAVNSNNFTALDVMLATPVQIELENEREIEQILLNGRSEKRASSSNLPRKNHVSESNHRAQNSYNDQFRNAVLVFSTLFATLSYQTALNPPGGVWQDYDNNSTLTQNKTNYKTKIQNFNTPFYPLNISDIKPNDEHKPGKAIARELSAEEFFVFLVFNNMCFFSSLVTIVMATFINQFSKINQKFFLPVLVTVIVITAAPTYLSGLNMITDIDFMSRLISASTLALIILVTLSALVILLIKILIWFLHICYKGFKWVLCLPF